MLAIVTNIDADHMSTYDGDIDKLRSGFIEFLHNLPFYGLAILVCRRSRYHRNTGQVGRSIVTYGVDKDADIRADNVRFNGENTTFDVHRVGREEPLAIRLRLPGLHNVRNALATIAVANELHISDRALVTALEKFEGIDRRFQILGDVRSKNGQVMLVDDYGHHPTEIAATLAAARAGWPGKRVVLVFQPHRYSRTRDLMDDFASVLSDADVLLILEVFAAGEDPIAGADGRAIARAVRTRGGVEPVFVETLDDLVPVLEELIVEGDLVLTMGAGDIGSFVSDLPARLSHGPHLKVHK